MIVKQAIGLGFEIGAGLDELDELAVVEEGVGESVASGVEGMVEELCTTELEDTASEDALDETWAAVTDAVLVC